ncbi:MAG: hypothetical protein HYZ42_15175 [Bacteroidetes bacterium]|nr:hypothetical protein [Bacteroidota bacterium]
MKSTLLILRNFLLMFVFRNIQSGTEFFQSIICTVAFVFIINTSTQAQVVNAPKPAAKSSMMYVLFELGKSDFSKEYVMKLDSFCNKWKTDLQIIVNKSILEQLASTGTELLPTFNSEYQLSGFKLKNSKGDLSAFPKPVTYRYKVEKPLDNTCVDTLWYYDVDKSNTLKRVVGKIRYEKKKDGNWLKFKTRWMPNGGDENWWARIRLGMSPCMFMANSFNIESPGYRITSIKIKLNDTIMKTVPFTRSIFSEMATVSNFIGSNPFLDNEFTWEELSTNELEINLTGLDGKLYVVNRTLMELKHSTKKMQPVLKEPSYHIHKDGCGHCGLTGGRIYFIRLSGNSTALATKKIMPTLFTIMPNDLIDLGSVVTK